MRLDRSVPASPYDFVPTVPSFTLTSDDVWDGEQVDLRHAHDSAGGANVSPQLSWSGFPAQTAGFAVTCFDPDVPNVGGWWHWLLLDLPVTTTSLPRGAGSADGAALPAGAVQLATSYGSAGYGGCAPPPGDRPHRYFFAVHALDVPSLGLDASTSPAVGSFMVTAHEVGRALLVPVYSH
jgi:Raf kinase inhibitor-like YbhB/YbcL family protein